MTPVQLRSPARFPQVAPARGHYESYYLKAADPAGGRAVWIRHTVLRAPGHAPSASVWLTLFDAAQGPLALKASFPASELSADAEAYIRVAGSALTPQRATGAIEAPGHGEARWDLAFTGEADEFPYLPRGWMYESRLPRTKATSLYPAVAFEGELEACGRHVELRGWPGMVGHNWGEEHAYRSGWIQGIGFREAPEAYLDVVLARIKLGRLLTPWIANGCLAIDGRRHRLGGAFPGAASFRESGTDARFTLQGRGVSVEGEVGAPAGRFVAWRYGEPGGGWHPTLHCSIADMRLRVLGAGEPERILTLTGAAALELQRREPLDAVPVQPFPDP